MIGDSTAQHLNEDVRRPRQLLLAATLLLAWNVFLGYLAWTG